MNDPSRYEANKPKTGVQKDIEELLKLLMSRMTSWKKDERVLDYGCGAGSTANRYFLPLAETSDSKIDAIDVSKEMIEHARANYGNRHLTYYIGDMLSDDFPLEGKTYDRIFSVHVLHYMQDYKTTMKKFYDLCKPGAEFGFTVPVRTYVFEVYRILGSMELFKPYMQGHENLIPEWYKEKPTADHAFKCITNAAKEAGFDIVHCQIHFQTFNISKDCLAELLLALNPFTPKIPKELLELFRKIQIDTYVQVEEKTNSNTSPIIDVSWESMSCVLKRGC